MVAEVACRILLLRLAVAVGCFRWSLQPASFVVCCYWLWLLVVANVSQLAVAIGCSMLLLVAILDWPFLLAVVFG